MSLTGRPDQDSASSRQHESARRRPLWVPSGGGERVWISNGWKWIGLRSERRASLQTSAFVVTVAAQGLEGDHYRARRRGTRQVTLIQDEHLAVIGALMGLAPPAPEVLRRNLLVDGS